MKYKVIIGAYITELEEKVNKHMEGGWKPTGGVTHTPIGFRDLYYQAMVKEWR